MPTKKLAILQKNFPSKKSRHIIRKIWVEKGTLGEVESQAKTKKSTIETNLRGPNLYWVPKRK